MSQLILFRKGSTAPKLSAAKITAAFDTIKNVNKVRVHRDELVTFMLNGGFKKLPQVKQSEVDSENLDLSKGWVIPKSCLGRPDKVTGEVLATPEKRESVRLWVKQQLSAYGIEEDSFSIIWVP